MYTATRRLACYSTFLLALLLISACSAAPTSPFQTPSALDPHGPSAQHLANLWWLMLALGTAILVLVMGLLFAALLRGRRATSATTPDSQGGDVGRNWPIWGGIALPVVVIGIVFGYSIYTLAMVENTHSQPALKINIVGRRWWWEVSYPDNGVTTANEIHIPVGVPVQLQLQSADVIHSFWVPELNGKMDLVPNRINSLTLQADQAGVYRGQCAEFCGLEHAHMGMVVIAQSSPEFNAWLAAQQQPAAAPTNPTAQQGQQVFLQAGCVFCHTVRGLDDKSIDRSAIDLGPDLTHLFSRQTIAGATLSDNNGNLAGWIADPQHNKPFVLMPDSKLSAQDLQHLLAYLTTLH